MVQNKEPAEPQTKIIDGKVFHYYRPGVYVRYGYAEQSTNDGLTKLWRMLTDL